MGLEKFGRYVPSLLSARLGLLFENADGGCGGGFVWTDRVYASGNGSVVRVSRYTG